VETARIHPTIVLRKSAVKKDQQRDASIDTFLRSGLRQAQDASGFSGPCVDSETLAAWTEGALSANDAAAVETHLANCASCQQRLAVFVRTAPPPEVPPSLWQRWRLQWAVPIAAAATAVAIWVAVPDDRNEEIQDAFAVSQSEPTEAQSQTARKGQAAAKSLPADTATPPAARERSEPLARRDADGALSARDERREASQEKEADVEGFARERAAAAAAPVPQSETRPLADAATARTGPASPALTEQRQAAFADTEAVSPDPTIRWRVLPTGQLERSTNTGQTWEPVPLQQKVTAVRALSATSAVITTADGRRFRTDDQGKTWNPVPP
jgi:hypothetical protein